MLEPKRLNAYRLEKQNIYEQSDNYLSVLQNQMALHSTDYLTPYLSLWARVKDFNAHEFYHQMMLRKKVARVRAMRGTLFIVHEDWIGNVIAALEGFLSQRQKESLRYAERLGVDLQFIDKILEKMNGNCFTSRELRQALDEEIKGEQLTVLIRTLEFSCKIARTNGRTPLDRVVKYGLWKALLPHIASVDYQIGLEKVLLQYIQQFGPVSLSDIAWWFPLTKTAARNALGIIDDKIEKLLVNNKEFYMTKGDFENYQLFSWMDNLDKINFLPYEDHFTKAYVEREWFLPVEAIPLVTEKGPMMLGQIMPSIWLNDQIIGRWRLEWKDRRKSRAFVHVEKIHKEKFDSDIYKKIEDKQNELEAFLNEQIVPLVKK